MDFTQLAREAHAIACDNGFHDPAPPTPQEVRCMKLVACLALISSEVSEALDELRDGRDPQQITYSAHGKPEGFVIELADIVLRTMDLAGLLGLDLESAITEKLKYNQSRIRLHGRAF